MAQREGGGGMNEIMTIQGIECYEVEGIAYLKLETVARGLGFTRTAESGNEKASAIFLLGLPVVLFHTQIHHWTNEMMWQ